MASLSFPLLLLLFVAAAGVVWVAGQRLSRATDSLFARLDIDDAFGGLVVIGIVALVRYSGLKGATACQAGRCCHDPALSTSGSDHAWGRTMEDDRERCART